MNPLTLTSTTFVLAFSLAFILATGFAVGLANYLVENFLVENFISDVHLVVMIATLFFIGFFLFFFI